MNFFDFSAFQTVLQAFGLTLFHILWQGMIIGIVCWILLNAVQSNLFALRFIIAYTALLLLFATFLGTFYWQYKALSPAAPYLTSTKDNPSISGNTFHLQTDTPPTTWENKRMWVTALYQQAITKIGLYSVYLTIGWLLGFFYYTLQLSAGFYQIQQMRRIGHQPKARWLHQAKKLQKKLNMSSPLRLLISPQVDVPVTYGWLRPVVLLPPIVFTELSSTQLEAIILHELVHIKRRDYLLNLIQSVIEVFLFFHPTYWFLANVIEREREQACDQTTLRHVEEPMTYARALIRLAEINQGKSADIAIAALGKNFLQHRIHKIMQRSPHTLRHYRHNVFKWYQLGTVTALCLLLSFFAMEVQGNKPSMTNEITKPYHSKPTVSAVIFIKLDDSSHCYIDGKKIQEADLYETLSRTITSRTQAGYSKNEITAKVDISEDAHRNKVRQLHSTLIRFSLGVILHTRRPTSGALSEEKPQEVIFESLQENESPGSKTKPTVEKKHKSSLQDNALVVPNSLKTNHNGLKRKAYISGQVIDAQTRKPLVGINVLVPHQERRTLTRANGRFTIQAYLDEDTLQFISPGYQTFQAPIHFTSMNVAMIKTNDSLFQNLKPNEDILFITDEKTAHIGGPASWHLYDINPKEIATIEVEEMDENNPKFRKFLNSRSAEAWRKCKHVVMVTTKSQAKQEAQQNGKIEALTQQLNKNIQQATQNTKNLTGQRPDTADILYIIDGVVIQGSGKKEYDAIDPDDIVSISVERPGPVYLQDGTSAAYEGVITIKTKFHALPKGRAAKKNPAFEDQLLIFPNPSGQQFAIQFTLEQAVKVQIDVTDNNGHAVTSLSNQVYPPGTHRIEWNKTTQPPGVYLIQISQEEQHLTRKVVLK